MSFTFQRREAKQQNASNAYQELIYSMTFLLDIIPIKVLNVKSCLFTLYMYAVIVCVCEYQSKRVCQSVCARKK